MWSLSWPTSLQWLTPGENTLAVFVSFYSYCVHFNYSKTESGTTPQHLSKPARLQRLHQLSTVPCDEGKAIKWLEITKRSPKNRERPPQVHTPPILPTLLLPGLLHYFWRTLHDISRWQEVHHHMITFLHGKMLRNLHILVSVHFPSSGLCHHLPECFLLVISLAAVAEEMLPYL